MEEQSLKIVYDGENLKSGLIPVKELAPSLIAFAEALESAFSLLNNEQQLKIYVKSDFEKGSFKVNLLLELLPLQNLLNLLAPLTFSNLSDFINIFTNVINFILNLKNRKIENAKPSENNITIYVSDGATLVITKEVFEVYMNIDVRKSIKEVVKPLAKGDIENFKIISYDNKALVQVSKEQSAYFDIDGKQMEEKLNDSTFEKIYSLVSISFKEDNKWRLNDGANTIYATMLDHDFLAQIDKGTISFAKPDLIKAEMRVVQTRSIDNILKTEYEILKVIELIKPSQQLEIPFEEI
jgi:hypothetical protein